MTRTPLRNRRDAVTQRLTFTHTDLSTTIFDATYGVDRNGVVREVFCKPFKVGVDMNAILRQASMIISVALQHGATMAEIAHVTGEEDLATAPRSVVGLMVRAGAVIDGDLVEAMAVRA